MLTADPPFEFSLRRDLSELVRMDHWVEQVAQRLRLDAELTYALQLCLTEAVTNIAVHGGAEAHAPDIDLSIAGNEDRLTARICDAGRPFDPAAYVPATQPTSLDDAQIGGNGIRLMRAFATAMGYRHEGGRNCLILTFAR